jgi:uncharacterized protein (DUF1684 family)
MAFSQSNNDYSAQLAKHREDYKASFIHYDEGPLDSTDLKDLKFYTADINYVIECMFELTPESEVFDMQTYSGKLKPYRKYGILRFEINGEHLSLALYQSQKNLNHPVYKDYLFLPFKDETNGEETYGGGRYIDLKITEIQGDRVRIDFNKAYNPWCAYSSGYSCPIPPMENQLSISIPVGEKEFAGTYKK